jgi:hypothetical protein
VTVHVEAGLVAVLTAQELVGGLVHDFARQVVQGHVQPGDGVDADARERAVGGGPLEEAPRERFEVAGVGADEQVLARLFDHVGDAGTPVALAGARDPGVRVEAHERPRPVGVDLCRLHVCNFD